MFKEEDEIKIVEFLKDNQLLYNKRFMDYKDPQKREELWEKFWLPARGGSRAREQCMARSHLGNLVRVHLTSLTGRSGSSRTLVFLTTTLCSTIFQSAFNASCEATV